MRPPVTRWAYDNVFVRMAVVTFALLVAVAVAPVAGTPTAADAQVPEPIITVDPHTDGVWGDHWIADASITVTIGSEGWSTTADGNGNWWIDLRPFDVQVGHAVSATDGTTTNDHTVLALAVTGADPDTNVVSGTADLGASVWVDVHGQPDVGRTVVADAVTGIWSTDFDDPGDGDLTFDLVPGTNGYTGRYDADNDATNADWHVLNPSFTVDPLTNGAWGGDFTPTATITLSRGADSCTTISDVWGNFGFDLNSCPTPIDLNAGDAVSVTDGATTKTHTITNLTVTAVVEATNTVTGTADANSDVHVWTHNDGSSLIVTADVSGVWTADFTGLFTFAPGTNGSAHQYDVDNDATNADWRIPKPQVGVDIGRNDVFGNEFAPNSSVTVTVNGGTVHGPFATDDWGNFGTPPLPIDIVAGDAVVASDSFDTVTHVVLVLDVTSVDPILETVSGTAPDGTHVDVWVHDVGDVNRSVTADAAGTWTADFTAAGIVGPNDRGTADLGPGSNGNSNRCDTEGNCTYAQWQLLDPYIGASVIHEEVWANGFPDDPAGQTLYYRLDDPATPGIDFEYDMPLILNPWGGTEAGDRSFGRYDVQAGQVFTVRNRPFDQPLNGGLERVLHISDIEVTGVDGGADIITGYADPAQGPTVCVWSQDSQLCSDEAAGFTWVGTDWIADFGAIGSDVKPGHWNSASQYDDDGDETHYWWNLPPWVVVELAEEDAAGDPLWPDAVRAEQWNGPVVTLTVNDEVVATWTVDSDWYRFELAGRDLDPSDVVTLSDAQDSKSVVVEPLTIEQVYFSGDTPPNAVAGTSSSQRDVHVVAAASVGGWWAERWVNADSGGDWFADFDNPGNGWREQWTAEFGGAEGLGRQLLLETYDEDNDRVEATQCEGVPRLVVARSDGRVDAYDFPEGSNVTIEISTTGDEYTATAERNPDNPCETIATFDIPDPTVLDGATVTATDNQGTPPVTHEVITFTVDTVDAEFDTVSGTAPIGVDVFVEADGNNWRYVTAIGDGQGNGLWIADFSVQGSEPGEEQIVDLGPGSSGRAILLDAAGNTTELSWRISAAQFQVDPSSESMWGNEFEPNAVLAITVNGTDVPGSYSTDVWGNFGFGWDPAELDLQAGQVVEVSDGTTTKTHTVTDLAVTSVDAAANLVSGVAAPESTVDVWVHDVDNVWRQTTAGTDRGDGLGEWSVDFTTPGAGPGEENTADLEPGSNGNSGQCDTDQDCTNAGWWIEEPKVPTFSVDVDSQVVQGHGWPEGATVTLTIGTYTDTAIAEPAEWDPDQTWFWLYVPPEKVTFESGVLVTMADDATEKTHTITGLAITGFDLDEDLVVGMATPGAQVDVGVHDENGTWRMTFAAAAGEADQGSWLADFGEPWEGEPPWDIALGTSGQANEFDDDGDSTVRQWHVPNPTFSVDAPFQVFSSNQDWELGDTITLNVDDATWPGPVTTKVVLNEGDPDNYGWWIDLEGIFEIEPGHVVTVTDGETTKVLTVVDLVVDEINGENHTVSGRLLGADAGVPVEVNIDNENGHAHRAALTEADGSWTADFSQPGDGEGEEAQPLDIVPNTGISAQVYDEDWDSTHRGDCFECGEGPGGPFVQVYSTTIVPPGTDAVIAQGFGPDVSMSIERDGVTYTEWPVPRNEGENTWVFFLYGVFDILPGDIVTVGDLEHTIVHEVTALEVTDIDRDNHIISGLARPDHDIQFNMVVDPFGDGASALVDLTVHTNSDGEWSVDLSQYVTFTADGFAGSHGNIYDTDDGQPAQTTLDWWVEPTLEATYDDACPIDGGVITEVHGDGWIIGHTVDVTVTDDGVTVAEATVDVTFDCTGEECSSQGGWSLDAAALDVSLSPGMTITASQWVPFFPEEFGLAGWERSIVFGGIAPEIGSFGGPIEPMPIDAIIDAVGTFIDRNQADGHAVTIDWGDDTEPEDVSDAVSQGTVNASHEYAEPGVYRLTLTVIDDCGDADTAEYEYVVVYDPDGGFVTGGGKIFSPPGAYAPDPSLEGNATFGFVSKYKKGANAPIGNTEFQFHAGHLNFHSDVYDWLVVAGAKAKFKGTGTINGEGNFGFMISAVDAALTPSTDVDLFRIKIWDKDDDDVVVYDNQMGSEDDADPTTAITAGSIVVHKAKK